MVERQGAKFAHAVLHTGGDHEVFRRVVLENEPHTLHIVASVAPVAQARQIAQIQFFLLASLDASCRKGDFAGHKSLATAFALVVEQDAGAAEHIVSLAVFFHNPVAVELSHCVRAVGVERGVLVLWHFFHFAVKFAGAGLVDATFLGEAALAHSLQHTQHAGGIYIGGKFGRVETHLHMALRRQVVDFGRSHLTDYLDQTHRVAHVGIVEVEMWFALEVGNAFAEIYRRAANGTVHVVTLFKQKFSQERAVLTSDARDEGHFAIVFVHILIISCNPYNLQRYQKICILTNPPFNSVEDGGEKCGWGSDGRSKECLPK